MSERVEELVTDQDTIGEILEAAYWVGYNDASVRYGEDGRIGMARDMEPHIIAALAEALLSDEAVEAAAESIRANWAGHTKSDHKFPKNDVIAKWALQGALAAIGHNAETEETDG